MIFDLKFSFPRTCELDATQKLDDGHAFFPRLLHFGQEYKSVANGDFEEGLVVSDDIAQA